MNEDINDRWRRFRGSPHMELEPTLQRLLNEYPTEALERMLVWARYRWLAHDWQACLNAAAVGHPISTPDDVEAELGVPSWTARLLAETWDAHGRNDPTHGVIDELISELVLSRSRCRGPVIEPSCETTDGAPSVDRSDRFGQPI